jgi:hypothetical protein
MLELIPKIIIQLMIEYPNKIKLHDYGDLEEFIKNRVGKVNITRQLFYSQYPICFKNLKITALNLYQDKILVLFIVNEHNNPEYIIVEM